MKPWSQARGSAAYYAHWDDHEFINDFSPFESSFPLSVGTVNIDGNELYQRGLDAFTDYNPVAYSNKNGLYRSARWGKNLEVFFLDERSFRSASADYQGTCDNPPGSGTPDLAPTAPAGTRANFAPLVPQFTNPPPPACVAAINDPSRTMLGSKQLQKFEKAIKKSDATFKVIFNEVPIQQYYALPYDRWEGYAAERTALLTYLQQNVKNVVFLTTDVHANLVNDARFCTLESGCPQDSGILDVTTGPIATASYSEEIKSAIGQPNGGVIVQAGFFKPQPPNGIGMACAATDQFSYAQVEVSKKQLKIDLLDQDDKPVKDTGDRAAAASAPACAQVVIPKQ
jgi:phosphodiesterase/alkaline phosphatase D-like protein